MSSKMSSGPAKLPARTRAIGVIALLAAFVLSQGVALAQSSAPSGPAIESPAPGGESLPGTESTAPPQPVSPAPADAVPAAGNLEPPATAQAPVDAAADASTEPAPAEEAGEPMAAAEGELPHDLSPWGMFMQADYVVKAVMIGLVLASIATWTIWLAKAVELGAARRKAMGATMRLERSESLDQAWRQIEGGWTRSGPVAWLIHAALREMKRSADLPPDGIKERTAIALSRVEARAGRNIARGTGVLATVGSVAPFVGLFGTVWGIMNSFISISEAKTTNLAVVAPGIAEALLATAIGLVAAIPAVIIYNVFARSIAGYRALLSDASAEVLQHLSRDLDRRELIPEDAPRKPALYMAAE